MKKVFLITAVTFAAVLTAIAQPKAIGLRLGGNQELSLQMFFDGREDRMLQIDFGSYYFSGLQGTVTYNMLSNSLNNAFGVYGGVGAALGFNWGNNDWYPRCLDKEDPQYDYKYANRKALRRYWFTGAVAQLGIEYRFASIPLLISVDYRPLFGIEFGKRYYPDTKKYSDERTVMFHTPGLFAFGISGKYIF